MLESTADKASCLVKSSCDNAKASDAPCDSAPAAVLLAELDRTCGEGAPDDDDDDDVDDDCDDDQ